MTVSGNIPVSRSTLPNGERGVDVTVGKMVEMAQGVYGAKSPKIRALAINIINAARVADKDYYGMIKAIGEWVRDKIRYVKDPNGQETLSYPEELAFNSRAGDCDDKTILAMALLGSLGIQSYPVVVGKQPGRYSHVYLHAIVPEGNHRKAGNIVPIDAIMREWAIGVEAPAASLKAKKLYTHLAGLAGLGDSSMDGYVQDASYLNEAQAREVPGALKSRIVDAGSYGEIFQAPRIQEMAEGIDTLVNNVVDVMEPAPGGKIFPRGPVNAAEHSDSRLRRRRPIELHAAARELKVGPRRNPVYLVDGKMPFERAATPRVGEPAPTRRELQGLNDALSGLEAEIDGSGCAVWGGLSGKSDPLRKATAASFYARHRMRTAQKKVVRAKAKRAHIAARGMFEGLGAIDAQVSVADEIANLAAAIALRARSLADKAAGASPERRAQLARDLAKLDQMDADYRIGAVIATLPVHGASAHEFATVKIGTVAEARDLDVLEPAPLKAGVVTPLPEGSVVRDQRGQPVHDLYDQLADGEVLVEEWVEEPGIGSFLKKIKKAVKKVTAAPAKVVKQVVKAHEQVAKTVASAHKQAAKAFVNVHKQIAKTAGKGLKQAARMHLKAAMLPFNVMGKAGRMIAPPPRRKGNAAPPPVSPAPAEDYYSTPIVSDPASIDPYANQQPYDPYAGQQPYDPYGGQQPYDPYAGQQPYDPSGAVGPGSPGYDPYGYDAGYDTGEDEIVASASQMQIPDSGEGMPSDDFGPEEMGPAEEATSAVVDDETASADDMAPEGTITPQQDASSDLFDEGGSSDMEMEYDEPLIDDDSEPEGSDDGYYADEDETEGYDTQEVDGLGAAVSVDIHPAVLTIGGLALAAWLANTFFKARRA